MVIERAMLTGGTGFVGSLMVRLLKKQGVDVLLLKRATSSTWRLDDIVKDLKVVSCDYGRLDSIESQVQDFHPEVFYHLGWFGVNPQSYNDPRQIALGLNPSLKLFDIARSAGCRLLVGLGSQAEYGPQVEVITENTLPRPVTLYGFAKLSACLAIQELCAKSGMEFLWLRLFTAYGPKDNPHWLIPHVMLKLLEGKKPSLTQGSQRWDFLYVRDAVEAIWQASINSKARGVFNLASGQAHRLSEVVETIRDLVDPKLELGFGEIAYPKDGPVELRADVARLKDCARWSPQYDITQGLKETLDWYRQNMNRYR